MVKSKEIARQLASEALDKLIDRAGSQMQLVKMLKNDGYDVTPQAVQNWVIRGQISKQGAIAVARHPEFAPEFSMTQLRPDISEAEWKEAL
jgi:hypothetical protein